MVTFTKTYVKNTKIKEVKGEIKILKLYLNFIKAVLFVRIVYCKMLLKEVPCKSIVVYIIGCNLDKSH